jgi:hypothetical protein
MNTPNAVENKLARIFGRVFRPRHADTPPSNPQPGPKIGQELNEFEQFLEDYMTKWRVGTQEKI